jgi:hypothetical protein
MATSSRTKKADSGEKATGSATKATGSATKTAGSGRKAATSGAKTAAGSGRKTAAGSSRKATGSASKTAGSGRKAASSGAKTAAGSGRKTAAGSSRKATGSANKTAGSANKTAGSANKTAGSGRKAASSGAKTAAGSGGRTTASSGRKATGSASRASSGAGRKARAGTGRKTGGSGSRDGGSRQQQKGIYVYGILPADVEMADEMPGVGDPPGQIRVVRSDDLAALVSEVDLSQGLGSPDDLTAHKDILDASAAELPVLPLRFGAVLTSEDAVAEELLDANHDEFADALDELDGRAQFVVKGRYVQDVILDEVLSQNKQAGRLAEKIHGKNSDATRDSRIRLGEMINKAVAAKREEDTGALGDAMNGHCVASVVRDPTHELDAVHVAFLVDSDQEDDMEAALEDLAGSWDGRVELRLLGPMAAYDFVGTAAPEG